MHRARRGLAGRRRARRSRSADAQGRAADRARRAWSSTTRWSGAGVLALIPPMCAAGAASASARAGIRRTRATIDALLVEAALAGERVVRLKGGDPSIFGRSTEEARRLPRRRRAACGSAPASPPPAPPRRAAGVSLSLRGLARQRDVRHRACPRAASRSISTGRSSPIRRAPSPSIWAAAAADDISRNLIAHGLDRGDAGADRLRRQPGRPSAACARGSICCRWRCRRWPKTSRP